MPNEFCKNTTPLTDQARELEIMALGVYQIRALRTCAIRSCINCDHFTEATEGCEIAGGARPPAKVIVLGCGKWSDAIPF